MNTYTIIMPAKVVKGQLTVPMGEDKPDIKAANLKEATKEARKLYGKSVLVIEPYDPNWV